MQTPRIVSICKEILGLNAKHIQIFGARDHNLIMNLNEPKFNQLTLTDNYLYSTFLLRFRVLWVSASMPTVCGYVHIPRTHWILMAFFTSSFTRAGRRSSKDCESIYRDQLNACFRFSTALKMWSCFTHFYNQICSNGCCYELFIALCSMGHILPPAKMSVQWYCHLIREG